MAHNKDAGAGAATAEQLLAYARVERDRAAQRAADRARLAEAVAPADGGGGGEALAAAEAALAKSEAAALAAFAGQGGGPCAYTRLGEQLIDVLADVALAGFAAELAPARFLCNETFEIREPGAVADVLRNALEAQCGATAARAARREDAALPRGGGGSETIRGTTQLIRAATRGEDARVRALVALGASRASAGRSPNGERWSAAAWARANGCQRALEALLVIPSPYVVSTLAGSGERGFVDGARAAAQFNEPCALAPLPDGSVVVAVNHCIRLIAAGGGAVSTLAGTGGEKGFADGPAAAARFYQPSGVVVGADGAIFVADRLNNRVRRIKDGAVTTFAGSGKVGGADGVGAAASFRFPYGLALGPGGVLYVTEYGGSRVRMISPAGAVTTLAGSGEDGFADGMGAAAKFFFPMGLALDPATGNVLVADTYNHQIRAVDPLSGTVSTLAGSGAAGADDGDAAAASFYRPCGVAVDAQGGILVADTRNHRARRIARL